MIDPATAFTILAGAYEAQEPHRATALRRRASILKDTAMNSIQVLAPYYLETEQTWVFDDDRKGLVREAFVAGIPEMVDLLVSHIPDARDGFRLLFSSTAFPGWERHLVWEQAEYGGNWYRLEKLETDPPDELEPSGWLCPALYHYFDVAPQHIYVKAEPLN